MGMKDSVIILWNKIKLSGKKLTEGGKEKVISKIAILLLSFLVIFSGAMLIKSQIDKKEAQKQNEILQEMATFVEENEPEIEEETLTEVEEEQVEENLYELVSDYPKLDIDYQGLKEMNSDLVGWMYIPALELSYPVVHYKDNDFYLEYSFEKKPSILGTIFIDYESPTDWTDFNTLIFGHNMKDQSMFGSLKRFVREDGLLESNPNIYIYTEEEVLIYQIFSIYIAEDGSQRYRIVQDDPDLEAYVREAKELSIYDLEDDFLNMDHIISLSTCYGIPGTSNRLLLHAVLLERGARDDINVEE